MKIGRRDFGVPGVKTVSHLSKTFVLLLAKNIFQELNSTLYLCWPRASLKNVHLMRISPVWFQLVRVRKLRVTAGKRESPLRGLVLIQPAASAAGGGELEVVPRFIGVGGEWVGR
jgi:hypothetical protein